MAGNRIWTVAVIGCGIGRSHVSEGYRRHPDKFQVLALCDIDEGRLAKLGDEFSIVRRTRSFDEVLSMDDVDIIDICTPPALHLAQILAAMSAGKEVVCEKPIVGSLAEIDRVIAAEGRAAGRVMPIFLLPPLACAISIWPCSASGLSNCLRRIGAAEKLGAGLGSSSRVVKSSKSFRTGLGFCH